MKVEITDENIDQIQDGQSYPWFCHLHNRPAELRIDHGWGPTGECWFCPDCNEFIENTWHEFEESGEGGENFPLLEG